MHRNFCCPGLKSYTLGGAGSNPLAISIVIPCYNEAANIERQLQKLQPLRQAGVELILVDASSDNSAELAAP